MFQFRGRLESINQYNDFLSADLRYIDRQSVKKPQNVSLIKAFLEEYVDNKKRRTTLYTTLHFCLNYAIIDLDDDLKQKRTHPKRLVPSQWINFLNTAASKFRHRFLNLQGDDRECFLNTNSRSIGKHLLVYVFKSVYPRYPMIDPIYNRIRRIGFHEFLRAHYPTLMHVMLPRIVSWGEDETIKCLNKHGIKLKPNHRKIVNEILKRKASVKRLLKKTPKNPLPYVEKSLSLHGSTKSKPSSRHRRSSSHSLLSSESSREPSPSSSSSKSS